MEEQTALQHMKLDVEKLQKYLSKLYERDVKICFFGELGKEKKPLTEKELKGFGYGVPYLLEFRLDNAELKRIVLETMRPSIFGHEHYADRAGIIIWQHSAFNNLPKHVQSIDVGAFTRTGELKSISDCAEFFIVTEHVEGTPYFTDLERIKAEKKLSSLDTQRCTVLSDYLVDVHSVKLDCKELYFRRIRDLVGHGECVFGLTDSYPENLPYVSEKDFERIEKKLIEWRWKLKQKTGRLCRVHGDYHPWNILFREKQDFTVLDRSRGEWGEAADDLAAMTINYLFYSLQTFGKVKSPFKDLFEAFWQNYLEKTGDEEILSLIQPFYAWRSLVIASPLWYPNLSLQVRRKIFNFIDNMLELEKLDLKQVDSIFNK